MGYHVVVQDCCGRFGSEGTFGYMENEDNDAVEVRMQMLKIKY